MGFRSTEKFGNPGVGFVKDRNIGKFSQTIENNDGDTKIDEWKGNNPGNENIYGAGMLVPTTISEAIKIISTSCFVVNEFGQTLDEITHTIIVNYEDASQDFSKQHIFSKTLTQQGASGTFKRTWNLIIPKVSGTKELLSVEVTMEDDFGSHNDDRMKSGTIVGLYK